jgi:hypothetical protein
VTVCCLNPKWEVHYRTADVFGWNGAVLKKIMHIALPNGVENGVHQLVKVALSSMVALFGTYQIAANGVAQSIWSLASIMGLAMAPVYTTVIGQCMGAHDIDSADLYFRKLNKITLFLSCTLEYFRVCDHAADHRSFRNFTRSKISCDMARADQQHIQRAGISFCGFARQRSAGCRRRQVHDDRLDHTYHRRKTVLFRRCLVCGWDGA